MMLNCIFFSTGSSESPKIQEGGALVQIRSFKGKGFAHMAAKIWRGGGNFTPPCTYGSDGPAALPLGNSGYFLHSKMSFHSSLYSALRQQSKLYIISTLNTDYLLWHTQLIDCVCSKILNHGLNHGLLFSLFKFFV